MMKIFILMLLGSLFMTKISADTLENNYLNETSFPIVKNNYVVISGCSGGGKSTLLSELVSRGYQLLNLLNRYNA